MIKVYGDIVVSDEKGRIVNGQWTYTDDMPLVMTFTKSSGNFNSEQRFLNIDYIVEIEMEQYNFVTRYELKEPIATKNQFTFNFATVGYNNNLKSVDNIVAMTQTKSIEMDWEDSSPSADGVKEYIVYRDGVEIGKTTYSAASHHSAYTDLNVSTGKTYRYRVLAKDNMGVVTPLSTTSNLTVNFNGKPQSVVSQKTPSLSPPTNIRATYNRLSTGKTNVDSVTITWQSTNKASDESMYYIYGIYDGNERLIKRVPSSTKSIVVEGISKSKNVGFYLLTLGKNGSRSRISSVFSLKKISAVPQNTQIPLKEIKSKVDFVDLDGIESIEDFDANDVDSVSELFTNSLSNTTEEINLLSVSSTNPTPTPTTPKAFSSSTQDSKPGIGSGRSYAGDVYSAIKLIRVIEKQDGVFQFNFKCSNVVFRNTIYFRKTEQTNVLQLAAIAPGTNQISFTCTVSEVEESLIKYGFFRIYFYFKIESQSLKIMEAKSLIIVDFPLGSSQIQQFTTKTKVGEIKKHQNDKIQYRLKFGDYVKYGKFIDTNVISVDGKRKSSDDVLWQVIYHNGGKTILMSSEILTVMQFDKDNRNCYYTSSLRDYLTNYNPNGGFKFSDIESWIKDSYNLKITFDKLNIKKVISGSSSSGKANVLLHNENKKPVTTVYFPNNSFEIHKYTEYYKQSYENLDQVQYITTSIGTPNIPSIEEIHKLILRKYKYDLKQCPIDFDKSITIMVDGKPKTYNEWWLRDAYFSSSFSLDQGDGARIWYGKDKIKEEEVNSRSGVRPITNIRWYNDPLEAHTVIMGGNGTKERPYILGLDRFN